MTTCASGLLALAAVLPVAAAQSGQWAVVDNRVGEPTVGLLDLPDHFGEECGPLVPKPVPLYESPSKSRAPVAFVTLEVTGREPDGSSCSEVRLIVRRPDGSSEEELPTDESGYEIRAAVVYERSGTWFRIALPSGSAWLQSDDENGFHLYPDLLEHHMAYLRKDWDGRMWGAPGKGAAVLIPPSWAQYIDRQISVDVLRIRRVGERTWMRVRLRTEECGESLPDVSPVTGWVPAYTASGTTTAWFYARGC